MTPAFGEIVGRAFRGGVDVSLRELVVASGLSEADVLGSCIAVSGYVAALGLQIDPAIERGDFDLRRALTMTAASGPFAQQIANLIGEGEHSLLEFKSSLVCDMRAYAESPRRLVRNDSLVHSVLKTICAFSNSAGGRLVIGVDDAGTVCGLQPDFLVMACDFDGWEGLLRSKIRTSFLDGQLLNSFVSIALVQLAEANVAVVDVVQRSSSTFLKHPRDDRHEFFVRQGNRSTSLDIHEFDAFCRGRAN